MQGSIGKYKPDIALSDVVVFDHMALTSFIIKNLIRCLSIIHNMEDTRYIQGHSKQILSGQARK